MEKEKKKPLKILNLGILHFTRLLGFVVADWFWV